MDVPSTLPSHLLQEYLRRSKTLPLHLHSVLSNSAQEGHEYELNPSMAIILEHSARLRSLSIEGDCEDLLAALLLLENKFLPLLEVFRLDRHQDVHYGDCCDIHARVLPNTPILASVRLNGVSVAHCSPPLGHLQSLELHNSFAYLDAAQYLDLLRSSPNLVTLTMVDILEDDFDEQEIRDRIELPLLKCLKIDDYRNTVQDYMRAMRAPILESLTVSKILLTDLEDQLSEFPSLRSLALAKRGKNRRTSQIHLDILSRSFPQLESLQFINCNHDDILHDLRTRAPEHDYENPCLAHLRTVCIFHNTKTSSIELLSFVDWRCRAGAPLIKVYLEKSIDVDRESLQKRVEVADFSTYPEIHQLALWECYHSISGLHRCEKCLE